MRHTFVGLCAVLLVIAAPAPGRADVDLWPLFEWSDDAKVVLYPLYVHEGDFLMVAPFYYRTHERRDHHFVWPLVKLSEGRLVRFAPFWFRGENSFTLFPIIHRTDDYTLLSVPPSYLRRDGSAQAVFPLYARTEHALFTFPTYYRTRRPDEPARDALWPLFSWRRDDQQDELDVFLGLAGWSELPDSTTRWLIPLFAQSHDRQTDSRWLWAGFWFQQRTPERVDRVLVPILVYHHDLVREYRWLWAGPWFQTSSPVAHSRFLLPIYVDVVNSVQDSHTTLIGPYFRRVVGERRSNWLIPIFGVTRGPETSMLWVATVIRTRAPEVERDWYFPVYMSTRRAPASGETSRWFALLWPLYERQEVRAADGELLERHRRFLLFSDSYEGGRRTFRLFGIPIIERL